jgi:ABC-type glycerol-3-phosphate transport system substrate-binding protein
MRFYPGCIVLAAVLLLSCEGSRTVQIWTDRPELAIYGEYFNAMQNQYKIMVRYYEFPAAELEKTDQHPDIVIGSWLKNASTGMFFKPVDTFFGTKKLFRNIFYPRLLAVGRIESSQYLLPVSFNVPALIFSRDREQGLSNSFTIGFDEIKNLSKSYNAVTRGAFTRMGFSPLWNDDFLFIAAVLFGSSFKEASPLAWDTAALDRSMEFIYNWTNEVNAGNQEEEDFSFKYFIEPPAKLIHSGRILFSYMESNTLFTLSEDSRNNLDFRWITEQNKIPLTEGSVYLGLPKKGKSFKAASAFVQWFFRPETQRQILEESRANRMNETVFGICGGFSALSSVTEEIFPKFYPDLLGRMPPSEFLNPPNNLPQNWVILKRRVIFPYLHDRARVSKADEILSLERRISDWTRVNR